MQCSLWFFTFFVAWCFCWCWPSWHSLATSISYVHWKYSHIPQPKRPRWVGDLRSPDTQGLPTGRILVIYYTGINIMLHWVYTPGIAHMWPGTDGGDLTIRYLVVDCPPYLNLTELYEYMYLYPAGNLSHFQKALVRMYRYVQLWVLWYCTASTLVTCQTSVEMVIKNSILWTLFYTGN